MLKTILIVAVWLGGVTLLYFLFTRNRTARATRARMVATHGEELAGREPDPREPWLHLGLHICSPGCIYAAPALFMQPLLHICSPGAFVQPCCICSPAAMYRPCCHAALLPRNNPAPHMQPCCGDRMMI